MGKLLEISNLTLRLTTQRGWIQPLSNVNLAMDEGEILAVVGESGCGKSLTAMSVTRLIPSPPARYESGEILLQGRDILKMSPAELRKIRGGTVSYVFQEPTVCLNPVMRVGKQIEEMIQLHRPEVDSHDETLRFMKWVGIADPEMRIRCYPHEFSGGMQQRIMIAMALSSQPKLLVADEPTTALDVTIQAQILDLLRDTQQRLKMAILLITHNLAMISTFANRVVVMYAGQVVESAPATKILSAPLHPYTRALIESVPTLGRGTQRLLSIPGQVPNLDAMPSGCRFHPRCPIAKSECSQLEPLWAEAVPNHWVRCPYGNNFLT